MAQPSSRWHDDTEDEEDNDFDEDMEALKKACILTGKNPNEVGEASASDSDGESGDMDDLELVRSIQQRFSLPLAVEFPVSRSSNALENSEDEDDFETLRAIQRRFEKYSIDTLGKHKDSYLKETELNCVTSVTAQKEFTNNLTGEQNNDEDHGEELTHSDLVHNISQPSQQPYDKNLKNQPSGLIEWHPPKDGISSLSVMPLKSSSFPRPAHIFFDSIKKNRSCQKFIRSKLIELEARIEENKELKRRVKCIADFQTSCKRRMGRLLNQQKDPRVQLISLPKLRNSNDLKFKVKRVLALDFGPCENSHVPDYKMVMTKFPVLLKKCRWSKIEKENLAKGIKQQFQEMLFQKSIIGNSVSEGSSVALDDIIMSITNLDITPENVRSFLPQVDWEQLASMYVMGRSGAECQTRWLNIEDPMINQNPWTNFEDKHLLSLAQQRGIYNWIEIATLLGTNRTAFQCLARYQRSLNPCILRREWTQDEDAQLRAIVESLGEGDWQLVASNLEGRTGHQCSNRWRKTLHPSRKRVGRWTVDEDKRLKAAVMLFGAKAWNKIAQFVPGRTQVQCRERWLNVLDPSLNLGAWTEEEDIKLKAAIAEHGHCWSKVAALVPPRTDNQCWRRWKVLLPHEVPLAQAARKIQRAALISNFVDREEERPALGPNDFTFPIESHSPSEAGEDTNRKRRKRSRLTSEEQITSSGNCSNAPSRTISRRPGSGTKRRTVETLGTVGEDAEIPLMDGTNQNQRRKKKPSKSLCKQGNGIQLEEGHRDQNPEHLTSGRQIASGSTRPGSTAKSWPVETLRTSGEDAEVPLVDSTNRNQRKKKQPSRSLYKKKNSIQIQATKDHGDLNPEHSISDTRRTTNTSLHGNSTTADITQRESSTEARIKVQTRQKGISATADGDGATAKTEIRVEGTHGKVLPDQSLEAVPRRNREKQHATTKQKMKGAMSQPTDVQIAVHYPAHESNDTNNVESRLELALVGNSISGITDIDAVLLDENITIAEMIQAARSKRARAKCKAHPVEISVTTGTDDGADKFKSRKTSNRETVPGQAVKVFAGRKREKRNELKDMSRGSTHIQPTENQVDPHHSQDEGTQPAEHCESHKCPGLSSLKTSEASGAVLHQTDASACHQKNSLGEVLDVTPLEMIVPDVTISSEPCQMAARNSRLCPAEVDETNAEVSNPPETVTEKMKVPDPCINNRNNDQRGSRSTRKTINYRTMLEGNNFE